MSRMVMIVCIQLSVIKAILSVDKRLYEVYVSLLLRFMKNWYVERDVSYRRFDILGVPRDRREAYEMAERSWILTDKK